MANPTIPGNPERCGAPTAVQIRYPVKRYFGDLPEKCFAAEPTQGSSIGTTCFMHGKDGTVICGTVGCRFNVQEEAKPKLRRTRYY
ncbi:MAG TPA: hypothetical protein PKG71_04840 [Candidatus Woesebacteria bacterium]|nr:hypothetical protein [Candidatus Woesebacteria bacterium]